MEIIATGNFHRLSGTTHARTMSPSQKTRPVMIALSVLMLMVSIGSLYAWSVFVTPLEHGIGAHRGEISAVFSLATLSFTLCMLYGTRLYARLSAPVLILLTGTLAAAGFALAGFGSGSILAIGLGFGGLFGIANGLGYGLSLQLVHLTWPHHRGLMTGLAVASYTLGSAAFSGLFTWGIELIGVQGTFLAGAGYMICVGTTAAALIKLARVTLVAPEHSGQSISSPRRDRNFWTLWLGFFFSAFAGVLVLGHAAAIVGAFDPRPGQMALGAALVASGSGAGRLAGAWLSDWQAPRRILSPLMLFGVLSLLALLVWPGAEIAMIALTSMGFGYGAVAGAYPVIVSKVYGAANVSLAYGRVFTAWGIAAFSGPFVGGLLFDWSGRYDLAIAAALVSLLCASLICRAIQTPSPTAPQIRNALASGGHP